jgi:16S rRNA (guanine527-N7)-methyltransferase
MQKFQDYLELLRKWNAKLNLTAIREPEAIVQRHFLECIFAAQQLPSGIDSLLDFGSGGGFPGLPIALCRPEIRVTLGESQSKKAAFLREAVRMLSVDAAIFHGRIETLGQEFDAVALRAVDKMAEALVIASSKVKAGGWLILLTTHSSGQILAGSLEQWNWHSPISIPNSEQEILLLGRKPSMFHVKQS